MNISERLKNARIDAGFRSASDAAKSHGWPVPTYSAHENGTRSMGPELIEKYALAFNADPGEIAFGKTSSRPKVAGISDRVLQEIITFVLSHEGAKNAPPKEVAQLVIELCHFVSRSGDSGLENIVDFQLRRFGARGN